ncbi:D-alanyl-D-alanine carboxypeptidase/D-alanyl-D-alanine-endopeptidase [bacterium]|nr:D-alanyl-D-alanine carboxypeptidase/D-alanyl-D-alanine-endopeptidase [bacterium]
MTDRRTRWLYGLTLLIVVTAMLTAAPDAQGASRKSRTRRRAAAPKPELTTADWLARTQSAEQKLHERWSVLVRDIATSAVVFSYCPEQRLIPASNRKIATFALALDLLGPDHQFRTEFGLSTPHNPNSAHFHGNLILRASGDPSLDNPYLNIKLNPATLFQEWAKKLRDEEGIAYVHGDLVIDASDFGVEQDAYPSVWDRRHRENSYAVVPSALAVSQNLMSATVQPSRVGRAGIVELNPAGLGVSTINHTVTTSRSNPGVSITFNADASEMTLSGGVSVRDNAEVASVPMPKPLEMIGGVMRQAIEDAGIRMTGTVRVVCDPAQQPGSIGKLIAWRESPTLNEILAPMMLHSNNFIAEQVWRAAAARVRRGASLEGVREIELGVYKRHGLAWIQPGYDGCGLSTMDRISARELVALMDMLYNSPNRDLLLDCLPVAGESGTLRHRSYGRGEGRVIAKTGTLDGASALTGFVLTRQHEPKYVFSIIGNANRNTDGRLSTRITDLLTILIRDLDNAEKPRTRQLASNQR